MSTDFLVPIEADQLLFDEFYGGFYLNDPNAIVNIIRNSVNQPG